MAKVGLQHVVTENVSQGGGGFTMQGTAERYLLQGVDTAILATSDDRLFLQHADITCSHCGVACRVGILAVGRRRRRQALLASMWVLAIGLGVLTVAITPSMKEFLGGTFLVLMPALFLAMVAYILKDSLLCTLYVKGDFNQARHKVTRVAE